MSKRGWILVFLVAIGLVVWAALLLRSPEPQASQAAPVFRGVQVEPQGAFRMVDGPAQISFPRDHGPHPDYLTEWWYYTGNLFTAEGQHFGYQLTFFRRALLPPEDRAERTSSWAADQVYMAHFALTDTGAGTFSSFERFSRGAAGLAGAQAEPVYQVWLEDWQVTEVSAGRYRLEAKSGEVSIALDLVDIKGPVLQGEGGYSPKGAQPGNASIYNSQTRLGSAGTITVGEEQYAVSGLSWMDHEYSTSALGEGLVGWDWFSLQLDDGSELMLFLLRHEDGTLDPYSSGTLIQSDGSTRPLAAEEFEITPTGTWTSPHTGARYPAAWEIRVPGEEIALAVRPRLADQEMRLSLVYWEGAVRVEGQRQGGPVSGNGYVELTGYAHSMQGEF